MKENYQYTDNMQKLVIKSLGRFEQLYTREDFLRQWDKIRIASQKNQKDIIHTAINDFKHMCKVMGYSTKDLSPARMPEFFYSIPDLNGIFQELFEVIYQIYSSFPTSVDYMERIVRRLAPEYCDDTVRTAILKKILSGMEKDCHLFRTDRIIDYGENRYLEAGGEKNIFSSMNKEYRRNCIDAIDDEIFQMADGNFSSMDKIQVLKDLLEKKNLTLSQIGVPETVLAEPYKAGLLKGERKAELLEQLCETAQFIEDHASWGAAVERWFPGFEKVVVACLRKQKEEKKTLADVYVQRKKDYKDKKGEDTRLLSVCNDMANGHFRTNGITKKYLYYFAAFFDMKLYESGEDTLGYDAERDIVKNLFEDYYADNLLRYMDLSFTQGNTSLDPEPTGEGINYKNYAEVIYLYYICKADPGLSPGKRLSLAESMITKCVSASKNKKKQEISQEGKTRVFQQNHFQKVLTLSEKELVQYMVNNYQIQVPKGTTRIMASSEQRSAQEVYEKIRSLYDEACFIESGEEEYYYLKMLNVLDFSFVDSLKAAHKEEQHFCALVDRLKDRITVDCGFLSTVEHRMALMILAQLLKEQKPVSLYLLRTRLTEQFKIPFSDRNITYVIKALNHCGYSISRANDRFCLEPDSSEKEYVKCLNQILLEKGEVSDEAVTLFSEMMEEMYYKNIKITRSRLVTAIYHYYLIDAELEDFDCIADLVEDFKTRANEYLTESRYQQISEKNLTDVFIMIALVDAWIRDTL